MFCFDLMQNQELPRSPITEAYYSRQFWLCFLGVVIHRGKNFEQSLDNVFFYQWAEHQGGRGCNVVGSAVYDFLINFIQEEKNKQIKSIRLICDSCGGQNKNYAFLSMINVFSHQYNISIEWIFPVRGHSYMPPDRAFGRVEKFLKKVDTILTPEEYFTHFKKVGQIRELSQDWNLFDWKSLASDILKSKQTFKISEAKRILIKPNKKLKGLLNSYSGEYEEHNILKRGKKFTDSKLEDLPLKSHVKNIKLSDVKKLIENIGINKDHEAFEFYEKVENESQFSSNSSDDED